MARSNEDLVKLEKLKVKELIGPDGGVSLGKVLPSMVNLVSINLSGVGLVDSSTVPLRGLRSLVQGLLSCGRVQRVVLADNSINCEGCRLVCKLLSQNVVTELDLSENSIWEVGSKFLGEAMVRNKSVRKLLLGGNSIRDVGAGHFAAVLSQNTHLQSLDLSSNFIFDDGVKKLARALATNGSLERLYLQGNKTGLRAKYYFTKLLKHNSSLKVLKLGPLLSENKKKLKENKNEEEVSLERILNESLKQNELQDRLKTLKKEIEVTEREEIEQKQLLESTNQHLKRPNAVLNARLNELENQAKELENVNVDLEKRICQAQERIRENEKSANMLLEETKAVEGKKADSEKSLKQLCVYIQQLEDTKADLQARLLEKIKEETKVGRYVSTLRVDHERLTSRLDHSRLSNEESRKRVAELNIGIETLLRKIQDFESSQVSVQSQIGTLQQTESELEHKLRLAESENTDNTERLQVLLKKYESVRTEHDNAAKSNKALLAILQEKTEKTTSLSARYNTAKDSHLVQMLRQRLSEALEENQHYKSRTVPGVITSMSASEGNPGSPVVNQLQDEDKEEQKEKPKLTRRSSLLVDETLPTGPQKNFSLVMPASKVVRKRSNEETISVTVPPLSPRPKGYVGSSKSPTEQPELPPLSPRPKHYSPMGDASTASPPPVPPSPPKPPLSVAEPEEVQAKTSPKSVSRLGRLSPKRLAAMLSPKSKAKLADPPALPADVSNQALQVVKIEHPSMEPRMLSPSSREVHNNEREKLDSDNSWAPAVPPKPQMNVENKSPLPPVPVKSPMLLEEWKKKDEPSSPVSEGSGQVKSPRSDGTPPPELDDLSEPPLVPVKSNYVKEVASPRLPPKPSLGEMKMMELDEDDLSPVEHGESKAPAITPTEEPPARPVEHNAASDAGSKIPEREEPSDKVHAEQAEEFETSDITKEENFRRLLCQGQTFSKRTVGKLLWKHPRYVWFSDNLKSFHWAKDKKKIKQSKAIPSWTINSVKYTQLKEKDEKKKKTAWSKLKKVVKRDKASKKVISLINRDHRDTFELSCSDQTILAKWGEAIEWAIEHIKKEKARAATSTRAVGASQHQPSVKLEAEEEDLDTREAVATTDGAGGVDGDDDNGPDLSVHQAREAKEMSYNEEDNDDDQDSAFSSVYTNEDYRSENSVPSDEYEAVEEAFGPDEVDQDTLDLIRQEILVTVQESEDEPDTTYKMMRHDVADKMQMSFETTDWKVWFREEIDGALQYDESTGDGSYYTEEEY